MNPPFFNPQIPQISQMKSTLKNLVNPVILSKNPPFFNPQIPQIPQIKIHKKKSCEPCHPVKKSSAF